MPEFPDSRFRDSINGCRLHCFILVTEVCPSGVIKWGGWGAKGAQALSIFGTAKRNAFSKNAQLMFVTDPLDIVLGLPELAQHTWRCPLFFLVPEATHEARRGPWWAPCQKSLRQRHGGSNGREKYFSDKGTLLCPPGKSMGFFSGAPNFRVLDTPWFCHR